MDTVQGILIFITRLARLCLRPLHHCYVAWSKPNTTSLLLGTLTDLARRKSELVAENAFLRQQLLILRRQVKRPACTKRDRMRARASGKNGSDLETGVVHRSARDATAVASPGLQTLLEVQVESSFSHTKDFPGNCGLNPRKWQGTTDYGEQSGSEANCSSWASASASGPFRST